MEQAFDPNKPIRHILGLSGGKDSTALALFMRDRVPQMEYVFTDTGKELDETYKYLDRIEAYLGKPVIRLNDKAGFAHWLKVYGGYLPNPNMRWCTNMLKLVPFEKYVGDDQVISYIGIRADENRTGYISTKPNIKPTFPFKEHGVDYQGVMRILEESGLGLPPYLNWGRSHSGCFFCFFQRPIEWVRLLENHPEQFEEAMTYEKIDPDPNKSFTWIQGMPLSVLRKPETIEAIKKRYAEFSARAKKNRPNKKLMETIGGYNNEDEAPAACLICQL